MELQAYPNPFSEFLSIKVEIEKQGFYTLSVYNLNGQLQKVLFNDNLNRGSYTFTWSGSNWQNNSLPASCYFVVLSNNYSNQTLKVIKR
ncbi:MAG: T9SS type A sorting domain-containing protein [Chlorobi bacterium]|nr:T9SS type A sorting domain-containing protein [Chlorobiota bacterium]